MSSYQAKGACNKFADQTNYRLVQSDKPVTHLSPLSFPFKRVGCEVIRAYNALMNLRERTTG
jgi:hypothetical protein